MQAKTKHSITIENEPKTRRPNGLRSRGEMLSSRSPRFRGAEKVTFLNHYLRTWRIFQEWHRFFRRIWYISYMLFCYIFTASADDLSASYLPDEKALQNIYDIQTRRQFSIKNN